MNFYELSLLLEYKFLNMVCMKCGHCGDMLIPMGITPNYKHFYTYGFSYVCKCKKSSVWSNSIRDIKELSKHLLDGSQPYTNGFCNDAFCGHCFGYLLALKNGVSTPLFNNRADRFGCKNCPENQDILIDGHLREPEGESTTKRFIQRYSRHADLIHKLANGEA